MASNDIGPESKLPGDVLPPTMSGAHQEGEQMQGPCERTEIRSPVRPSFAQQRMSPEA